MSSYETLHFYINFCLTWPKILLFPNSRKYFTHLSVFPPKAVSLNLVIFLSSSHPHLRLRIAQHEKQTFIARQRLPFLTFFFPFFFLGMKIIFCIFFFLWKSFHVFLSLIKYTDQERKCLETRVCFQIPSSFFILNNISTTMSLTLSTFAFICVIFVIGSFLVVVVMFLFFIYVFYS